MTTNDNRVHRRLSVEELRTILTSIETASDTGELLRRTLTGSYQPLLAAAGQTLADATPDNPIDPTRYAIPTTQWRAIIDAATNRAELWGTSIEVALELANLMPGTYEDPQAPVPAAERIDYRPEQHRLTITRSAADVIAACEQHVWNLAEHLGWDSPHTQQALRSWHRCMVGLFSMRLGDARVMPDGLSPLSLFVTTGSGLVYAIIFHPDWATDRSSYPQDTPKPGQWSTHS